MAVSDREWAGIMSFHLIQTVCEFINAMQKLHHVKTMLTDRMYDPQQASRPRPALGSSDCPIRCQREIS